MIGLQEAQYLIQDESSDDSPWHAILSAEGDDFSKLNGEVVRSPSGHAGVLYRSTIANQFLDQRIGTRYVAVAFQSFIFASVYLPHKGTMGKTEEAEWSIVQLYQDILKRLAMDCHQLQHLHHIKHLIISIDANVEVHQNSVLGNLQVSGDGVLPEQRGGRGGHEKRARIIRKAMSEALVATLGALGLQLANTFGTPRHTKEEGETTWRSTRGYEHIYDYLAVPKSWRLPSTAVAWLVPGAAHRARAKKSDRELDTFWSDHKLVSLTAPDIEELQQGRARGQTKSFARWHVDPGLPTRNAAAHFDRTLLPRSHPFSSIEEEVEEIRNEVEVEVDGRRTRRRTVENSMMGNPLESMTDGLLKAAEMTPTGTLNKASRTPRWSDAHVAIRQAHYALHRLWKRGEVEEEVFKNSRKQWNKVRRARKRECIEYAYRDGRQNTPHVRSLLIDGVPCSDRRKWTEALRRHGLTKYASEDEKGRNIQCLRELKKRAEEEARREGIASCPLDMGVLLQTRAKLKVGRAVGSDGISAAMLKTLSWETLCLVLQAFQSLYRRQIVTPEPWRKILVTVILKNKLKCSLDDSRGLVLLSVFGKWYSGCLTHLVQRHIRARGSGDFVRCYGFVPERRCHEVTAGLKNACRHASQWGKSHALHLASLDVACAFDSFSVSVAANALEQIGIQHQLAFALLESYLENEAEFRFQEISVAGVPWERCIRTGSLEAPALWIALSIVAFDGIAKEWYEKGWGWSLTDAGASVFSSQQCDWKITNMLWADNVILLAATATQLKHMIADMTIALRCFGFDWKESSLAYMKLGCDLNLEHPLVVPVGGSRVAQGGPSSASLPQPARVEIDRDPLEQELETNEKRVLPHMLKLKQVNQLEVLGTVLDRDFSYHADIVHRMKEMEKAFWSARPFFMNKQIAMKKKIRRYVTRVQTRFLYGIEGISINTATLKYIHNREGALLSKLVWRRKKQGDSWAVFGRRMWGMGRDVLHKMGKPSLVQLTLYKQWMWAKDVAMSVFPVGAQPLPNFVQDEPCVTGGSQSFVDLEAGEALEATQSQKQTLNRRNMIMQTQSEAKRRRQQLSGNTTRMKDKFEKVEPPSKARKITPVNSNLSSALQARALMLVGGGEWSKRTDDFLKCIGSKAAKPFTRKCTGRQTGAFKSWASLFEDVGTTMWMTGVLGWTEHDWIRFCKDVCKHYGVQNSIFKYFVLRDPAPHCKRMETEEEERENEESKNKQKATRLANIFEEQSEWFFDRGTVAMEIAGDSQVVINWLLGLWQTANFVYASTVQEALNGLYELTQMTRIRPPSAGHNIFKWVYREGNDRADALTWEARKGNTGGRQKHDIIEAIRNKHIKINALRGSFDGGRSEMGVGCGWLLDVHAYYISPSFSSPSTQIGHSHVPIWINNVMADAFLLPPCCTVTQAELSAASRLLSGLQELVRLACLC